MVWHCDLCSATNADGDEVVDPSADEECADGPGPGADRQGGCDEENRCEDESGCADPECGKAEGDHSCEGDDTEAEGSEDGYWDGRECSLRCEERLEENRG